MTDLTALEEAAKYALAVGADDIGGIAPSTILSLISTIRDLERERDEALEIARTTTTGHKDWPAALMRHADMRHKADARAYEAEQALETAKAEARKAGMMRAAEIAEARDPTNPFAPLDTPENWTRQQIATAIRAEAKGSGT